MNLLEKIKEKLRPAPPVLQREDPLPPPQSYFLELTDHCNLRCSMCNFHSPAVVPTRKKGFMDTGLAVRLLHEIDGLNRDHGIPWVALHGAGEPLLHKDLRAIIGKTAHLRLSTGFLTNGMLLGEDMSKGLIDAGLSWIGFSIDGTVRETFNKYRCGAEYDRVVRNALAFIERARVSRPDLKILVNMTVQEEMREDVPRFIDFWLPLADEVSVSPCRPVGTRDNILVREAPPIERIPCYMLFTMLVVFWDGSVGLCCEDWFNDGNVGTVSRNTIEKVWNGAVFNRYRTLHKEGRYSLIGLCADCNSWYNAVPQTLHDRERDCRVVKGAWQCTYSKNAVPGTP